MHAVPLPASGMIVLLRPMTGAEDLMLLEATFDGTPAAEIFLAVSLAARLAETQVDGTVVDWRDLPVVDLDTLLLHLRWRCIGDTVRGVVVCAAEGCTERVQIEFGIAAFLAHGVAEAASPLAGDTPGWFPVGRADDTIRFRLPTPRDVIVAARTPRPERALAASCIHPPTATHSQRRRAERAMEALAPLGVRNLQGTCRACGVPVTAYFDIRRFCLQELHQQAALLYDDLDVLARAYHWSEASILSLANGRRGRYAERARAAIAAAA